MGSINVNLNQLSRRFRWASELKDSHHGNYMTGCIQLPTKLITVRHYRLELSLVPSKDCVLPTHPNLLHLTKPVTYETLSTFSKRSWRQSFLLDFYNGSMDYSDGKKKCTIHGIQNKGEMYDITLGPSCVMLTIVKPLQQKQKRSSNGQVSIEDVLSERMAFDGYEESQVKSVLAKYLVKERELQVVKGTFGS